MIDWIIEQQWAMTISLLSILACGIVLKKYMSSQSLYRLWGIVPLVLLFNNVSMPSTLTLDTKVHYYVVSVAKHTKSLDYQGLLFGIWLLVFLLLIWVVVIEHYQIARKLQYNSQALNKIENTLPVYSSNAVNSPILFGLFKQRLFVPHDFTQRFSAQQQSFIYQHEWVHFTRRDNLFNAIAILVLLMFWFNPVCWLAYGQYRKHQEMACDAEVLNESTKSQRIAYCNTLIECINENRKNLTSYSYYMEKSTMKQRLINIKTRYKGNPVASKLIFFGVLLIVSIIAVTNYDRFTGSDAGGLGQPIERVNPNFPQVAIDNKISGEVLLGFNLTSEGKTSNIVVLSSTPNKIFDQVAIEALEQWRYGPGENTDEQFQVQLDFALE